MKTLLAKTEKKKIVIFKKEKTRCRRIVVFFFYKIYTADLLPNKRTDFGEIEKKLTI